jgi:deazaflavin-dependent oxidoreductase (nitroreductase family)
MSVFDDPLDPSIDWARDHVRAYAATGGEQGYWWRDRAPTLLLTTLGRRSGRARRTGLIFGRDGDDYVVVASRGGADSPPDWYRNLSADPRVRVQVKGEVFDATARTASPAERARLWPAMARVWPDYDRYQQRTERVIPVVILSRA